MNIYVDNSYTTCMDASEKVISILYDKLSFYQPGFKYSHLYKRGLWDGKTRLYSKKSNSFPTGLLPNVLKILNNLKIKYNLEDFREKPNNSIKLQKLRTLPKLRDYQEQALEIVKKKHRGIISLPMGTGKTRIALEIILQKKVPTLFITPTVNIALQTYKIFRDVLGRKNVGIIYGGKKEFNKNITIACIASLTKNKKLKNPVPKEFFDKISMIITDEAHHQQAKSYTQLNKTVFQDIYYRYGLSATYWREDGSDMELYGVLSDILIEMTCKEAIYREYLVKPKFYMIESKIENNQYDNYQQAYKDGIVLNGKRNQIIIDKAKKYQLKPTLVLVREIEHGEYLERYIPGSKLITGRASGKQNAKFIKEFEQGKHNPLIATTVIGEGSDIPSIEVIIMALGMKAESFHLQRVGRGLRLSPNTGKEGLIVIDVYDRDNSFLERHSKHRKKTYLKHLTDNVEII